MIGGDDEAFRRLEPIFASLAPGVDAAARTPGRDEIAPEEHGYLHCGPSGAGHFVKMIHNGIEYGLMAALAEGFSILQHAGAGLEERERDAETAPLAHARALPLHVRSPSDRGALASRAASCRRGSSTSLPRRSSRPRTSRASQGRVSDSGEGRWTSVAAIETGTPAPVLTTALYSRFTSRDEADFANRLLSAMRAAFGGHLEKPR